MCAVASVAARGGARGSTPQYQGAWSDIPALRVNACALVAWERLQRRAVTLSAAFFGR